MSTSKTLTNNSPFTNHSSLIKQKAPTYRCLELEALKKVRGIEDRKIGYLRQTLAAENNSFPGGKVRMGANGDIGSRQVELLNDNSLSSYPLPLHSSINKQAAFTLAEVLITLGIIGVVAAMTLPTLIQNYQTKAKVTTLSKAQSVISQAVLMLANENGGTLAGLCDNDGDHNCFAEKLAKHTKNIKYCSANSENEFCKNIYEPYRPHIFLSDGLIFQVYHSTSACKAEETETTSVYLPGVELCAAISVDYNGLKAPNKRGEDIFGFGILKKGQVVPWGAPTLFVEAKRHTVSYCTNKNNPPVERQYCTFCYMYGDCK